MTAIKQLAAASGTTNPHVDDSGVLVRAVMRMPGHQGIRQQQLELLRVGRETWARTRAIRASLARPEKVPYLDRALVCHYRPEPLRLDVLVGMLAARTSLGIEG
jgi:hypothetical protein